VVDRGDDRLRDDAVGAPRRLLRRLASENRPARRRPRPQPLRIPSRDSQTHEDPLMEDAHVHALDYLSVFRRPKWWLAVPIVASVGVGAALVRWLPKEFKGTVTIGVVAPAVSPNLVGQSAPLDNSERMRAFSQQLLSAPVLARVAREERLASGSPDDKLI